jgi:hypothetical protein
MAIGYVNFKVTKNPDDFTNISPTTTSQEAIPDTSWTAGYRTGNLPSAGESNTSGGWVQSSGDAAWAIGDVSREGHYVSSGVSPALLDIKGFTPGESIRVTCYSRYDTSQGRISRWIVNGSAPQDLACYDTAAGTPNLSSVVVFDAVADGSGVITVSHSNAPTGSLTGRSTGLKIEQIAGAPSPAITLTQTEITPGGTISGSYANWGGTAPTKLEGIRGANVIDSATAGGITGLVITGDGTSGTFTATTPAYTAGQNLRTSNIAAGISDVTWRLS